MTWVAIGTAGAGMLMSGMAGAQESLNKARLMRAQQDAKIRQLSKQFDYEAQNVHNNKVAIDQQKLTNDVAIQENKLKAEDAFAQSFAGSGVKGRSVDALEAQIASGTGKAQAANAQQATQQHDRQFLGLMRTNLKAQDTISQIEMFDASAEKAANDMAMMSAGVNGFLSGGGMEMLLKDK